MTSACSAAALGFDLCALRTRDETIAVAAKAAAEFLRSVQRATIAAARSEGVDASPKARTSDRLRWEWLASTAAVLDRSPDSRLASECVRVLSEVDPRSASRLPARVAERFRMAVAEAYSLAATIEKMRRGALVFHRGAR